MKDYIVNPVLVRMKESERGSIYQSIVAMGFRARQINDDIKHEITERMADIVPTADEAEANYDQIAISKEFDKYPKPTFLAMNEIFNDKIHFEIPKPEDV